MNRPRPQRPCEPATSPDVSAGTADRLRQMYEVDPLLALDGHATFVLHHLRLSIAYGLLKYMHEVNH